MIRFWQSEGVHQYAIAREDRGSLCCKRGVGGLTIDRDAQKTWIVSAEDQGSSTMDWGLRLEHVAFVFFVVYLNHQGTPPVTSFQVSGLPVRVCMSLTVSLLLRSYEHTVISMSNISFSDLEGDASDDLGKQELSGGARQCHPSSVPVLQGLPDGNFFSFSSFWNSDLWNGLPCKHEQIRTK